MIHVWYILGILAAFLVGALNSKAAYWNGASDGWRAAKRPNDSLRIYEQIRKIMHDRYD